jgi:hypothetical protein
MTEKWCADISTYHTVYRLFSAVVTLNFDINLFRTYQPIYQHKSCFFFFVCIHVHRTAVKWFIPTETRFSCRINPTSLNTVMCVRILIASFSQHKKFCRMAEVWLEWYNYYYIVWSSKISFVWTEELWKMQHTLHRRKTPLILISHTQQDANTQN